MPFNTINNLPILEVLDAFNIPYKKKGVNHHILKDDGRIDESFVISEQKNIVSDFGKTGIKGGPFDFIGLYSGICEADMRTPEGRATTLKMFVDKGLIQIETNKRDFVPSLKDKELLEQYNDFKLNGYKKEISAFLLTRGIPYDFIQAKQLLIGEIFADIGYYDNYYCSEFASFKDEQDNWQNRDGDKPKTTQVFMFPCYDQDKNLIGIKLRRKDGKTIRGKKSLAIGRTGLLYTTFKQDKVIIVEGETDYLILRILGYKNVVANLGGVQSCRVMIKTLLFEINTIICLYDNDLAGKAGKESLSEFIGRPIYEIVYPVREDNNGNQLSDVNDYYKIGYDNKQKWDKILSEAMPIGGESKNQHKTDFIFLRKGLEYYDIKAKTIQDGGRVATYLGKSTKELAGMVHTKTITEYWDMCYCEELKPDYYNTLDTTTIVKHGGQEKPILHPHIKYLIENICNNIVVNIEWLHQAILYKLTHIDDVFVPAVLFYGRGKSGKGTFINLLSKIFGHENTLVGLGQRDLESSFDSYTGEKLIVEYKEIASGNTFEDRKILDKLKGIICEPRITVNAKHQKLREVDNIAWFQLSSNHPVPIQLDSKHSGNRRFTIIKTGGALDDTAGTDMNNITFKDKKIIKQYIAWLYETYPDIPKMTQFDALDNAEKRQLENNCEGVANLFFEWFEKKFPYIRKVTNKEKTYILKMYIEEMGENQFDTKYKQSNFDSGLSHRYEKKTIRVKGGLTRGYVINKTKFDKEHIPQEALGYFTEGELMRFIF